MTRLLSGLGPGNAEITESHLHLPGAAGRAEMNAATVTGVCKGRGEEREYHSVLPPAIQEGCMEEAVRAEIEGVR